MRAAAEMEEGAGGDAYLYEEKYTSIVAGLKGAYQFNDSLGVYLGYRSIKAESDGYEGGADGFMAGSQYKF